MKQATASTTAALAQGLRGAWNRVAGFLDHVISHDLIALAARFALAGIFFSSVFSPVSPGFRCSE